jgi:gliding motility-associated-like protein
MIKRYPYILLFGIVLSGAFRVEGQATMPDNVCIGQLRRYNVYSNPGSTYTWWIDGIVQAGYTNNEFVHTWNYSSTYLLEVQERSQDGCLGPVRSLSVVVTVPINTNLIIPEAFSPNNDLINDVWNIGNIEAYPKAEIIIYNRWGQSVWRSEQGYPQPWDGKSNGVNLPVDSYHYVIDLHNGSKQIVGFITLVK